MRRPLDHLVSVRLTSSLFRELLAMASRHGVSLSELMRTALREYAEVHEACGPPGPDGRCTTDEAYVARFWTRGEPATVARGHNAHGPETLTTGQAIIWVDGCPRCDAERAAS